MNIVFVEPAFPASQRQFVRALAQVGAKVIGVGESPPEDLDDELRSWMRGYYRVVDATDEGQLDAAVRWAQERLEVDALEATTEAHQLAAAAVREAHGIPGTPVRAVRLCTDHRAMEQALGEVGIATTSSTTATSAAAVRAAASRIGYPLLLKPPAGVGAHGAVRVDSDIKLSVALIRFGEVGSLVVEEFVQAHHGLYDTLTLDGRAAHDWVTHCYPDVTDGTSLLGACPQLVTTNRIDSSPFYRELRELGARVVEALGVSSGPTRMHWSSTEKGLYVNGFDCWIPAADWDSHAASDDVDVYWEWAHLVVHGTTDQRLSRAHTVGIVALPQENEGLIRGYSGLDELRVRSGQWIVGEHLPPPGTPTQPLDAGVETGAWLRLRHPNHDVPRELLDDAGRSVRVKVV